MTYYKLIIGGFGFGNLGDEAILAQTLRTLKKGDNAVMLSPYPTKTCILHELPLSNVKQRLRVSSVFSYFRYVIKLHKPTFALIHSCIEILNLGGGNLNSFDKDELYHKLLIYSWANMLSTGIHFGAQTIGPLNKLDYILTKRVLCSAVEQGVIKIIPVRDEMSKGILDKMGIPNKYQKDDAFEFTPKPGTYVPISSTLFGNTPERRGIIKIGVNLKGSIDVYGGNSEAVFDTVYTLCKLLLRRFTNIEIHPIYTSTDERELKLLWRLRDRLDDARVAEIMPLTSADEVKYSISKMDVCIGTRYHFCVFALASDIPCIAVHSGDYQKAKLQGLLLNKYVRVSDLKIVDADSRDALDLYKVISFLYPIISYKGGVDNDYLPLRL